MTSERRHLGFLCSTGGLGGLELNLIHLARWMTARGWTSTVFGVAGTAYASRASSAGLPFAPVPQYGKYFDAGGARALARALRGRHTGVVFLSANRDANIAALAKRLFARNLRIVYVQAMQIGVSKRDIFHTWHYRALDAWIAPLPWLARQAETRTRIPRDRIHVIPHGIEVERFAHADIGKAAAREALDLPQDAFIVGTIGRVDPGKYQDVLIRALARGGERMRGVHALLVGEETRDGDTEYGVRLRAMAAEHGLAGRVHFRPFREDVETAFAAMDCFSMTTPAETYGMVTIEAMASGVPVIAAAGGGSPEILGNGAYGLLVEPLNPEALADALLRYAGDPALRAETAAKARAYAVDTFAHDRQVAETEKVLAALGA